MTEHVEDEVLETARARIKQIFRFLKAFAEPKTPVRTLREQRWSQLLRDLPEHPSIEIGTVQLAAPGAPAPPEERQDEPPLIRVRRPELTDPPLPPQSIVEFLVPSWKDPNKAIELRPRNIQRDGRTITEQLTDDEQRAIDFERWSAAWEAWAQVERPARAAMRVFEDFYELHGTIELESERVELMLGDGRLCWQSANATIDHPVLLQRVEMEFDANVPEFRIVDADRAPELHGALLQGTDGMTGEQVQRLRLELETEGYHPLAPDGTPGFLRRLVQMLGPRGTFSDSRSDAAPSRDPIVARDAALFLRVRLSGFPAAFDRVLRDLEQSKPLPISLTRLVGVEPPASADLPKVATSPWSEPADVLLSKPANPEQVQIARALERHHAVLVQGPPGTGKSHTIANLIGHLVARGQRVLVTSQTTKALRVLREHVVEQLQPLCVAVLENDIEGRKQLEQSVREIVTRLTQSNESFLEREVGDKTEARSELNGEIERITAELRAARAEEYLPIVVAGEATPPCDAARWVIAQQNGNDWIPGPLESGAPLPLSVDELIELYDTNGRLTRDEERELDAPLPDLDTLPWRTEFAKWVTALGAVEPPDLAPFWSRPASESEIEILEQLNTRVREAAGSLSQFEAWQLTIVSEGHSGGAGRELWVELAALVNGASDRWDKSRRTLLEYDCKITSTRPLEELRHIVGDIVAHLEAGSSLSKWTLLTHGSWKAAIRDCSVNGTPPATVGDFRALGTYLTLEEGRRKLAVRWSRQAEPIRLPFFKQMGNPPEPKLREYAEQFEDLLDWWSTRWQEIEALAATAGFNWQAFRQREVARSAPATPFDRDVAILSGPLQHAIACHLAAAQRVRAERCLEDLDRLLAPYSGRLCTALRAVVRARGEDEYEGALTDLQQLAAKWAIWQRRDELLGRLGTVARGWANSIRNRSDVHGASAPPGEAATAWRWRHFRQDIDRRAALDEVELARRLYRRRDELRETTADLIDRLAWLEQKRRTNLAANSALTGWEQTQRRIGRGTGRRVPQLQAEARRLLTQAREAVPVWIMPLARVAESFDATQARFDVVIVDEASQSDVMGLLAWYLGERVVIVGDNEQVSPIPVGERIDEVQALINEHLPDIPNRHLYDGKLSIYDLAGQSFGEAIRLREHFRCAPDIIEFSNALSYDGEIRPLRNPGSIPGPHTIEYVVDEGVTVERTGKTNRAEAQTVVALLKTMTELPDYQGKSIGAITLLGDEQAQLIQHLAVPVVGAAQLELRRFASGNSGQFQGDERDIIFLSMVDVPGDHVLPIRQLEMFKQRYNVAASRARDQLWLVHSLDPNRDLQTNDLRRRLIEHVRDPSARRREIENARRHADTPFEEAVFHRLIDAGYAVQSHLWIGGYRVDLVVGKGERQAVVECDGDRFHGVDQIPADMARQAVLERVGWRFVRIRGTRFFSDQSGTMEWVFSELARFGVQPMGAEVSVPLDEVAATKRDRVLQRAREIMTEQGWLPELPGPDKFV